MTRFQHLKSLLVLGLPLIGSHIAQMAITTTDTLMLGWYGVTELAAVTLASSIFFTLFIVGSGFAWAVMPLVAAASEKGDEVQVRRVTRMGLWLSMIYGSIMIPAMIYSEPIFRALGQEPDVAALAQTYLRIAGWGILPALFVMVLKAFLSALERTQIILWVTIAAAILNGLINYALIFGNWGAPELGVQGAAIASVIVQVASGVLLALYVSRVLPKFALFQRIWRRDPEALGTVFRLGWPIGVTSFAETGLFTASAIMVGTIGAVELAAHGIALQLASITFMVHLGLSQAATVRAGRALGRKDIGGLRQGGGVAVGASVVFAAVTIAAFLLVPEFLLNLFVDPDDPQRPAILAIGVGLLSMAALFQFVDGAQVMALGLLRGVQDTRVPMIHATLSYWGLGLPAGYVLGFPLGFGAVGVWMGLVVGLAMAAILLLGRFYGPTLRRLSAV
ncbi:MATE family efflux transporter [Cognatishimia sp. MH4019]|uniref:MATE family efflux transporter n=1 Tax=Cognatishimia sp. MH4019 TaxID=2854030 RepID=UPI001CD76C57|nr:MATE family efflux transporter [Cognatishimia sp. MH4019]